MVVHIPMSKRQIVWCSFFEVWSCLARPRSFLMVLHSILYLPANIFECTSPMILQMMLIYLASCDLFMFVATILFVILMPALLMLNVLFLLPFVGLFMLVTVGLSLSKCLLPSWKLLLITLFAVSCFTLVSAVPVQCLLLTMLSPFPTFYVFLFLAFVSAFYFPLTVSYAPSYLVLDR